jgi:branched-chain amino acid transport system permease protein
MRSTPWLVFTALLAAPPLLFDGGFALTLASQAGIAIILALSYNMLFGQTGLLSFGHAVYAGIGGYAAIHALRLVGAGELQFPVALLPLIGGMTGAALAVLLGYVSSRRGGLTFAMISLGIGEMVHAAAVLFPAFFGGEAGITADRTAGTPLFGITFASAQAVCWLIAAWTLASALAMHAFTRTPLGRLANAVRDNPARAADIGIDPRRVRWLVMIAAGFFAGIAGGLSALLFEIVSADNLAAGASASMLFAAFIGGSGSFFGPALGALLITLMSTAVATVTPAWPIYLGLLFIAVVLKAPGGIVGLCAGAARAARRGRRPALHLAARAIAALAIVAGLAGLIETAYFLAGSPGSAGNALAALPGGRIAALGVSGLLLIGGRAAWRRLSGSIDIDPGSAAAGARAERTA